MPYYCGPLFDGKGTMGIKKIKNHKSLLVMSVLIFSFIYFSYDGASDRHVESDALVKQSNKLIKIESGKNGINQGGVSKSEWQGSSDYLKFINDLVVQLTQQHAHEIESVIVQASFQDLRDFIVQRYPQEGEAIFTYIITQAFSHHAVNILALIQNLDTYQTWHAQNLLSLNEMNSLERDGQLWQKRYEIFLDLAEQLWEKETDQKEYKQKLVQQTLKSLNTAKDMAMNERLYILKNTIEEQYGDTAQSLLINKGLLANMYFRLESVQQDLSEMSVKQREQTLASSRRQLGYSEKNISKLAMQDEKKEKRWKNGYQYMQARDQLASHFQGSDLNQRLTELRLEHFKHEAATIEAEESSGFMRYERPRIYGSN